MRDFRFYAGIRWLVLSVLFLAGCSSDGSLPQDAQFNAGDAASTAGNGLVVVGLRVAHEPVVHNLFLGDQTFHPSYQVTFRTITPDGRLGRMGRLVNVCETSRVFFDGALSDCVPSRLQYKVIPMPAGQYSLNGITYTARRMRVTSWFQRSALPDVSKPSAPARIGDPVGSPERSFTVRAGEIVYIGDLGFDFEPRSPFARLTIGRSDAAARGALAGYPGIRGEIVFRPVSGGNVTGTAEPLPACPL